MPSGNWINVDRGDEVAILPLSDSSAAAVLDTLAVSEVGPTYIKLSDGQLFDQVGGASQDGKSYIVPATDQHRAAMKAKRN